MSTTLQLVRQEMLTRCPDLGRVLETPTSITTTTAVFASLATGGVLAEKYLNKWLVRPDAASAADRIRRITGFATSTGTITVSGGANYADTTVTSEACEILAHEEYLYGNAINQALYTTKKLDRSVFLGLGQGGRHYLTAKFPWIVTPNQVKARITKASGYQLSNNRDFTKWNSYQPQSGVGPGSLIPDDWTLSGTGCTMARGGTYTWRGSPSSLSVTPAAGVAAVLSQTIGLDESGVTADSLRGETVTVTGRIRCTDASNARVWVSEDGGTTKNYSDYHTGGSSFEELTKEYAITSSATNLTFGMEAAAAKLVCQVGELWLDYGTLDDSRRRFNESEETVWDYRWAGQDALPLVLPALSKGRCYAIYSERGYPQIAAARLAAGTADDDVIDADKTLIAVGAIFHLYSALAESEHSDQPRWAAIAEKFRLRYEQMHPRNLLELDDQHRPGLRFRPPQFGSPVRIPR